jgi:ribosome modulation factor
MATKLNTATPPRKAREVRDDIGETRARAKKKAEALFAPADQEDTPQAEKKLHTANLATEADLRRWFVLIQGEERDYEKVLAKLRAERQQAKTSLDKIYADAADILKSRGVTKRVLKAMYELSKRDESEVSEEMQASVWAMRAAGLPIGTQLSFWSDGLADPADAYNKAKDRGKQAGLEGVSTADNPFNGHQLLSQAWLEGWHEGQSELLGVSTRQ